MTPSSTYRPASPVHAPRLRDADGSMRQAPRRFAGHAATHPVQPLKGLPGTRATGVSYRASVPAGHAGRGVALSYRALAPGGAGFYRICTGTSESRPTANYSLLTANSSYTFSAKERDSETGLSYFGSRYYSSDLSIWLSVDPMSDKYPSLSPYTYCADNPVRLVDPNGEEIGDFYDQWGRKIGSDGQTDNNVFIVSNQDSQNKIKENRRNHGYTNAEDVKVDVATTYDVLNEVADVYERTVKNGGYNEEASALPSNGGSTDWERKSGVNEHSVEVPLPQGDVLIHSHTLRKRNPRNPCDYATPKVISGADQTHFKNFKLNVVVGDDGGDCVGGVWSGRKATVSFYNSNSENLLNLSLDVVKKIVNK